jgi:hypothetical protein
LPKCHTTYANKACEALIRNNIEITHLAKKKLDEHQRRVHDMNSPMIKRSISSPTRSRILKPSMLSTYTSLTTGSNLSMSSFGNSDALATLPHDVTERKYRDVYQSHNPDSSPFLFLHAIPVE